MSPHSGPEPGDAAPVAWFVTTHWSVVLNAKAEDSVLATEALGQLCRTYWQPVHNYVRSRGQNPADAEDLTQQFFARFLEKQHYRLADRQRGKFRTFLLTSVKNFLVNERERATAQKRGGDKQVVSLDETAPGEDRPLIEIADTQTADWIYERSWATTLLAQVRHRLQAEYAGDGKGERFALLETFLPGEDSELTYAQAGECLGVAEGTIKSDVHRLKKRYGELLRDEIAQTVATPGEVDEELQHLLRVFSDKPA